ncbi:MAG: helix-turn-helix transcriptional regulator [Candidatus Acidiferrales bacterium]|jgi:transcriptional regulator with XRE-family HTH domain
MRPGEQLRELRNRLGITTREVEEFSRAIAEDRQNEEFYISNAWLTQLENKNSVPSIYKLYSLSVIYRTKFHELLTVFGIDLNATSRYQLALPLQNTHLTSFEPPDSEKAITFPVRFDKSFSLDTTSLISRMVEVWGEVPIALIQKLDVRHCQYGFVGIQDYTMYPLLRPGSFVQIESRPNRTQTSDWRTEFDRPIYFVELRDGYACSWCEVRGSQLTLIPHPLSGCAIRQFAYPSEAEIVGQVTGVAMRLVPPEENSGESPKLPRRS